MRLTLQPAMARIAGAAGRRRAALSDDHAVARITPLTGNWSLIASQLLVEMAELMAHYHREAGSARLAGRRT
jgi:hypothetical protein